MLSIKRNSEILMSNQLISGFNIRIQSQSKWPVSWKGLKLAQVNQNENELTKCNINLNWFCQNQLDSLFLMLMDE
jgi:hypothetical protein